MAGWRAVGASVVGTSHEVARKPCQDFHAFSEFRKAGEVVFAAAVADGAGSAERSDEGARLVCEQFLIELADALASIDSLDQFGLDQLSDCWETTRLTLADHAMTEDTELAAFASTFLTAVVLPSRMLVAQLGDGAIVVRLDGAFKVPIWPQQGEFANTTNFLTGRAWERQREMLELPGKCDAVVMFSDGLQQLILRYADREAEGRFVEPLVASITASGKLEELDVSLREFLGSERVNNKTDDDKTLVLARMVE